MLSSAELSALRKGFFELDCPWMVLQRSRESDTARLEGPGTITWSEGKLSFKLYAVKGHKNFPDFWGEPGISVQPGELIPEEAYYSLTAKDWKGRQWNASHILPRLTMGEGTVVRGSIRELEQTEPWEGNEATHYLSFEVLHDLDFPCNDHTLTFKRSGTDSKERPVGGRFNLARFTVGPHQFVLSKEEGYAKIEAKLSRNASCPAAALRIIEALQFVLAQPVKWTVMYERLGNSLTTRVRPVTKTVPRGRLNPPIRFRDLAPVEAQVVWELFGRFFTHICGHTDNDRFHPISAWIDSVRAASTGTINSEALALGVAVEGVLKETCPEEGTPSSEVREAVDELIQYVARWDGPREVRERAQAVLRRLAEPSARGQLRALESVGAVNPEYVRAWADLRHPAAHGVLLRPDELDKVVRLCDKVTALLYQIIFKAIGYTGAFTDYGALGWPMRRYPDHVVTS